MTERTKIVWIYVVVAILSVSVVWISMWVRSERKKRFAPPAFDRVGMEAVKDFGMLEKDLALTNQEGEEVKLSDLKDKVWVATNFFAACPNCMVTSSSDLTALYKEFGDDPDFHIVSITVNPEDDTVNRLQEYAKAMGAEAENWWFLRGPADEVYEYVEKEMKFMRVSPNPPGSVLPFTHDYGLQVYAKGWKRVQKKDLHYARQQSQEMHKTQFEKVRGAIRESLAEDGTP